MSTVLIANFSFSLKIIEQKTNGKIEATDGLIHNQKRRTAVRLVRENHQDNA